MSAAPFPPPHHRGTSPNIGLVRHLSALFHAGDIDGLVGYLHPDVVWIEGVDAPDGGTFVGPAAVRERVLERLATEWAEFRVVTEEVDEDGPYVTTVGFVEGTYGATGTFVRYPSCRIWRIEGGLVVGYRHVTERGLVHEARGVPS